MRLACGKDLSLDGLPASTKAETIAGSTARRPTARPGQWPRPLRCKQSTPACESDLEAAHILLPLTVQETPGWCDTVCCAYRPQ